MVQRSQYRIAHSARIYHFKAFFGSVGDDVVNAQRHHLFHFARTIDSPYENFLSAVMSVVDHTAVDEQVIHALRRSFGEAEIADRQVCIISFYDSVLCRCKKEFPRIRCFYLTGFDPAVSPQALVAKVKAMDLDGIDCEASTELTDKYVKAMHKAGLEFHVWTVDEPEKAIYFMNLEVDSITTNRPYALWCEINEG